MGECASCGNSSTDTLECTDCGLTLCGDCWVKCDNCEEVYCGSCADSDLDVIDGMQLCDRCKRYLRSRGEIGADKKFRHDAPTFGSPKNALDLMAEKFGPSAYERFASPTGESLRLSHKIQGDIQRATGKRYPNFFADMDEMTLQALMDLNRMVGDFAYELMVAKKHNIGLYRGPTEKYGAYEPLTYSEMVAQVMASDPAVQGMAPEQRVAHIEKKPFDYLVSVWLRHGDAYKVLMDGLYKLREDWLRYMINNDDDLDDTDKENYSASLEMYYNESFGSVKRVNLSSFERAFWKKPGNSEIWKISIALALPTWLNKTVGGLENAAFLDVDVPRKEELEELTGAW